MNAAQLRKHLAIDDAKLREWIKRGLPHTGRGAGRRFDATAVKAWLLSHGASRRRIVHRQEDVAKAIGISVRQVAYHLANGMPGQPARAGETSSYDLDECEAWLKATKPEKAADSDRQKALTKLAQIKAEREALKLAQTKEELIDAGDVARFMAAHASEAKAVLAELEPLIYSELPEELRQNLKDRIRQTVADRLQQAFESLARLAEGIS